MHQTSALPSPSLAHCQPPSLSPPCAPDSRRDGCSPALLPVPYWRRPHCDTTAHSIRQQQAVERGRKAVVALAPHVGDVAPAVFPLLNRPASRRVQWRACLQRPVRAWEAGLRTVSAAAALPAALPGQSRFPLVARWLACSTLPSEKPPARCRDQVDRGGVRPLSALLAGGRTGSADTPMKPSTVPVSARRAQLTPPAAAARLQEGRHLPLRQECAGGCQGAHPQAAHRAHTGHRCGGGCRAPSARRGPERVASGQHRQVWVEPRGDWWQDGWQARRIVSSGQDHAATP